MAAVPPVPPPIGSPGDGEPEEDPSEFESDADSWNPDASLVELGGRGPTAGSDRISSSGLPYGLGEPIPFDPVPPPVEKGPETQRIQELEAALALSLQREAEVGDELARCLEMGAEREAQLELAHLRKQELTMTLEICEQQRQESVARERQAIEGRDNMEHAFLGYRELFWTEREKVARLREQALADLDVMSQRLGHLQDIIKGKRQRLAALIGDE